jgi:hypothetical protein
MYIATHACIAIDIFGQDLLAGSDLSSSFNTSHFSIVRISLSPLLEVSCSYLSSIFHGAPFIAPEDPLDFHRPFRKSFVSSERLKLLQVG